MKISRLSLQSVFLVSIFAGASIAGTIKVWTDGQVLRAADLNANFQHIHGLMVGGHGPRLVDADVSGNASIASSKLAQGAGITDGWASGNGAMANSFIEGFNYTGVTHTGGTTTYVFTGAAGLDGNGVAVAQCSTAEVCRATTQAATSVTVVCSAECTGIIRVLSLGL